MHSGFNQVLRRSVTAACLSEPEVFETGIIRGAALKYNDSAALRLRRRALLKWHPGAPSKVLIVKKPKNPAASAKLQEIGAFLRERGIEVFVERVVWATEFKEFSVFDPRVHRQDIDFVITLGGDGTVLYMTSLFEEDEPLPPVLCFAMGSLGFLTPFDAANFQATLTRVLDTSSQPLFCTLRTRKRCEVVYDGQLEAVHHVLNECVLDRGAFPGTVLLEIFVDGSYVTNVEADGLIISTPSGSTAYSMSAGGPMVAPSVPCTVFTPLAPLSLSFRPVVIPESSSICVHLPTCARSHARASFDGKKPMRVRRGTSLFFTTSLCPLPVISLGRMDTDWYEGITSKLKWNQAIRQLPSCPSPVGAQQQELCSARYADRTAAEAALAAATEGCPVDGPGGPFGDTAAAVAAASAALHAPPSHPYGYLPSRAASNSNSSSTAAGAGAAGAANGNGDGNGNGNGASSSTSSSGAGGVASSSLDFGPGRSPHRNLNGNGSNGNGNGNGHSPNGGTRSGSRQPYSTSANGASPSSSLDVPAEDTTTISNGQNGSNGHNGHSGSNGGSNITSCSGVCTPDDHGGSITDSMTNSLEDADEAAAAAAAASKATVAVTVAAAALTAVSTPLRPAFTRRRSSSSKGKSTRPQKHSSDEHPHQRQHAHQHSGSPPRPHPQPQHQHHQHHQQPQQPQQHRHGQQVQQQVQQVQQVQQQQVQQVQQQGPAGPGESPAPPPHRGGSVDGSGGAHPRALAMEDGGGAAGGGLKAGATGSARRKSGSGGDGSSISNGSGDGGSNVHSAARAPARSRHLA